jgi:cobalt/nickel transport system permease protein
MSGFAFTPLWAVHISDGVLTGPWLLAGFVGAAVLALIGAWRIRDEDIPRVALLTAAFFVASLIHVRVGPTSVHLLLNGLVGVVLGRYAGLAIPVALLLQAVLIGHGGISALGVNTCVMALPAFLAWGLIAALQRVPWVRRPWFRGALVAVSTLAWTLSVVYSVALLASNRHSQLSTVDTTWANAVTLHPVTLASAVVLSLVVVWAERRMEGAPEFPVGLLIGEVTVLATVLLSCLALVYGGQEDWPSLVLLTLVPHLFIAAVEGIVLGFTVGFLVRVKPEMVRWTAPEEPECLAGRLP